jgi:hypothetical protein
LVWFFGFGAPMVRIAALVVALVAVSASAQVQEKHCQERGAGAILMRSAFAHGYRHGYEAGYHEGNIDINMARPPRTQAKQFKEVSLGYDSSFGAKKSFELGFAQGLKAGYGDGYAGKTFRAVDGLRSAALAIAEKPIPVDPENVFFDRGVSAGYQDGLTRGDRENSASKETRDLATVSCSFHPGKPDEVAAEPSYCDGYRRGFLLGEADRHALGPEQSLLEASK